jgi:hypothetical protein
MKKQRTVLFRIIFFLTVFFSVGLNSYQNLSTWSHHTEISNDKEVTEDSFSSHIDNLTIDQISQTLDYMYLENNPKAIATLHNFQLISQFRYPVWQPPRVI